MALNLSDEFGSNPESEVNGVWVSLGEDAEVCVARLGNVEAQRAYKRMPRNVRRQIEGGVMGNERAERFLADFLANNILKGWKHLVDVVDGEEKDVGEYSVTRGIKMMLKHRRFREKIWELSTDDDLFNTGEMETVAKNSPESSSGTSNTKKKLAAETLP